MFSPVNKVLKIVVAGNGGIGKTTLLKRFCYNEYVGDERLTVGTEIFIKKFRIDEHIGFMQIWDLGGQEQFRFFIEDLVRGAHGAILGFDIKRRKSYLDLRKWLCILRDKNPDIPIVLIATKIDLGYHPTLNPTLAKNFVSEFNLIDFIEVSSKDNLNIDKPFKLLLQNLKGCSDDSTEFLDYELDSVRKPAKITQ